MSGSMTYLGGMTIGDCLPTGLAIYGAMVAQLQAKLAGLIALKAQLGITPPSVTANIDVVAGLLAALQASLSILVTLPSIDFKLAAIAKLIAGIEADLAVLLGIQASLGTAGVHAYAYDGDVASLGASFDALGIPGAAPGDHCNALVLATTAPATWVAMGKVFVQ